MVSASSVPEERRPGAALLVGLSGGIGSGKSTVARALAARGAIVVDADVLARRVVERGTPGHAAVVARFGPGVVASDGELDRPALARLVFADTAARAGLNAIVHPLVAAATAAELDAAPADAIVVVDVPLLVEAARPDPSAPSAGGGGPEGRPPYDVVVIVEAPVDVRLDRLVARGMDREDAIRRVAAQASDEERRAAADEVLVNATTPEALEAQVERLWRRLLARAGRAPG